MFREIFELVISATNGQSRVFWPSRVQRKLLSGQVLDQDWLNIHRKMKKN